MKDNVFVRRIAMFGVYFGKYLQDIGVLPAVQYEEIIESNGKNH